MNEETKKYWTEDSELIEKYILGKISIEEKKRLDIEIADCEPCKKKLREEMESVAGIRRYGRDTMKSRIRTKLKRERATQYYSYQYIGLAAAVVIVAIGVGLYQIWFSDLVAPKQFHQQEIVLKPQKDSAGTMIGSLDRNENVAESQQSGESKDAGTEYDRLSPQQQSRKIADGRIANVPTQSSSGAVSTPQHDQQPADALAEADGLSDEMKASENLNSAIWLIGKVVMISDQSGARFNADSKMEISKQDDIKLAKQKSTEARISEKVIVRRQAKDEGIIFKQRAMKDLPINRIKQHAAQQQEIETLLERTKNGISLTLFDDSLKDSDLQEAVVETFSNDSLVVSFPNQRIAFSLPSKWNFQSTRRR